MKSLLNRWKYKNPAWIIIIYFIFSAFNVRSQDMNDSITLDYCRKLAQENFPLIRQKVMLEESQKLKLWNITTAYLPQLGLNGQVSYQSDVTNVPLKIPGINIPEPDKDIYKFTLDLNQVIFDGGVVMAQRKTEKASLKSDLQSIDVELYKINDRINQIYFSLLLLQANEAMIRLSQEEIRSRLSRVESGVRNGVVNESNADILNAELLKADQQSIEIQNSKLAFIAMLEEFINKKIAPSTVFTTPALAEGPVLLENKRPELRLFELQKQKLNISRQLINTRWYPKIFGFAQLGYGKPGLNMLSNSFDKYYLVGAKLSWNPWNWNQTKNDKKILNLLGNMIDIQQEVFEKNLKIARQKDLSDLNKYEQLMKKDDEIITLRSKIKDYAGSQLENGVITATEYITELNNRNLATLNKEIHRIQYIFSKINLFNNTGQ